MKRSFLAVALTLFALSASAQQTFFHYAAKFVCGRTTTTETAAFLAAPGSYFTAINVRNADVERRVQIRKRFSVGRPGEQPGPLMPAPPNFIASPVLPAGRTMLIECRNIWSHLQIPVGTFVEGYAELRSAVELDVVSVLTVAPPNGGVASIHTERVPLRRSTVP